MTRKEAWNLKGEKISDNESEKWYQWSGSTWLLIIGLVLFNFGCFLKPAAIDSALRLMDVRLWPWWYFLIAALLTAFSVTWFFILRSWPDHDDAKRDEAVRFIRMSIVLSVVFAVLIFLNVSQLMIFLFNPLKRWFGIGIFSWNALMVFVLLVSIVVLTVYFIKEWLVVFLGNRQ